MGSSGLNRRAAIWALVAAILLLPGVTLAQAGEFDPALRAFMGRAVEQTAPILAGVEASGGAVVVAPPVVALPTPTPGPVLIPTPTPGPVSPGGTTTHSSGGVTLQTPADWDVDASPGDDVYIEMSPFMSDLYAVLLGGGADFPGVLGVVLMRTLAESLVGTFMDDTELLGVEVFFTDQGVPALLIEFAGDMDFEAGTGAMYVFAPGKEAFLIMAFAPNEDWDLHATDLADIVASITFDDSLRTLFSATVDSYFADDAETLETLVFAGWHAVATDDDKLPLIVVEPDLTYVAAFGKSENLSDQFDAGVDVLRLLVQATADSSLGEEVIASILDSLGGMGSSITVDPALSTIYPTDEGGIIRVVGVGALDDETDMPIAVYLDLRPVGSVTMVVIGDLEQALADEDLLLELLAETLVLD